MYEILIHTRENPGGIVFTQAGVPVLFSTAQQAQNYINKLSLGWRNNGYCTVKKREVKKYV